MAKLKKRFDLVRDRHGVKLQVEGTDNEQKLPVKHDKQEKKDKQEKRLVSAIKRKPIMIHKETQFDSSKPAYMHSPSYTIERLLERVTNEKYSGQSISKTGGFAEKRRFLVQPSSVGTVKVDRLNSILNGSINNEQDTLSSRVMSEYFLMIEELILVADQKLELMLNNFSPQIWKSVVKRISNRIKTKKLQFIDSSDSLESIFTRNCSDPVYCGEETIINLINLCSLFDYSVRKQNEREYFKEKKLDRILAVVEKLEKSIKVSKSPSEQNPIVGYIKDIKKVTGSVRGIDFKSKNKTVGEYYSAVRFFDT